MINKIGLWLLRIVLAICLAATAWANGPEAKWVDGLLFIALLGSLYCFDEKKYDQPEKTEQPD